MNAAEWIFTILAAAGLVVLVVSYFSAHFRTPIPRERSASTRERPARTIPEDLAHKAGVVDVFEGWVEWARTRTAAELAAERQTYDEWSAQERSAERARREMEKIKLRANGGIVYREPSPMNDPDENLAELLNQQPKPGWGLEDLRQYMTMLTAQKSVREKSRESMGKPPAEIHARIVEAAAIVTDLRDETYDPADAPQTSKWAFHNDAGVRAAYIEGRGAGTEKIMDAITSTRTRLREIDQAGLSIEAASARHAAALRALRETNPQTSARDAHAEHDAAMREIAGDDTTTQ